MKAQLVKIGNSRGVRIPKPLIEECQLTDEVELKVDNHKIIISAVQTTRMGWDEAFQRMHQNADDQLLETKNSGNWDDEEWEWK